MKNPSRQRAVRPQIKLEFSPFFEPSEGGEATNRAKILTIFEPSEGCEATNQDDDNVMMIR